MFIKNFLFKCILFYSKKCSKNKNIWIFGSWQGQKYVDNSKYFFQYVNEHEGAKIKKIWLTDNSLVVNRIRESGGIAFLRKSIKGIFYAIHAGIAVCTEGEYDASPFISGKTLIIQLWHGVGIKKVGILSGWSSNKDSVSLNEEKDYYLSHHSKWYWMVPSQYIIEKYKESFMVPESRFYVTGQPRDDQFFLQTNRSVISRLKKNNPCLKILAYLPTHRNFGKDCNKNDFFDYIKLEQLNERLKKENILLLYKPHFHEINNATSMVNSFSNILIALGSEYEDIYEFLPSCDALITDYSGVMFSFLVSDKPIIFYPYDYDDYILNDAGLYYDYQSIVYGPICHSWDDVITSFVSIDFSVYEKKRNELRHLFNPFNDGKNCVRVLKIVQQLIKDNFND